MDNMYADDELDPVMRNLCTQWMTKVRHARDHKRVTFQESADEAMAFFNGPKQWDEMMGSLWSADEASIDPSFKVAVNLTFEFVTIFGPAMYAENPVRTVKPRMPVIVPPGLFPDPMLYQSIVMQESQRIQQQALTSVCIESYLNYTPVEFGLAVEARQAIDEGLIKGRGCLWTELYKPPGAKISVVKSFWDTTDNLFVDPDAYEFGRALWIAKRCVEPVWKVEMDRGLRRGCLRGNSESQAKQADVETNDDALFERKKGLTNDLIVYWKIWSKMGIGGRMHGIRKDIRDPLEMFGDYCYLEVAENTPFLLNLSPEKMNDPSFTSNPQAIFDSVAWPTPYWADDEWPVSVLDFHRVPNSPWPLAHIKAGMGELKFINWAMSFLMSKIHNTSRDFIAVLKSASEELKTAILEGKDLTLLEIDAEHKTVQEVIQFLQHPPMNGDIWKVIEAVQENFRRRVGLSDIMYGEQGATQIRSAEEASLRDSNTAVRPDDMRKQVETWMTKTATKEALCARYHLTADDVQPILGIQGSWAWGQYVATKDLSAACRELEYRIEAGSTQRPNKNWEVKTMTTAVQTVAPILQQYQQLTGDFGPMNNLIADWAKANDLDPSRYPLRAPMPVMTPVMPGAEQGAGVPQAGQQAQAQSNIPPPG